MIVQLMQVNGWIINSDNKPSLQAWQWLQQNQFITSLNVEPRTINQPSLSTIEIQIAINNINDAFTNFNLIKLENIYYKIIDVSIVQEQAKQYIYHIKGQIDYYLSFLLDYFNEQYEGPQKESAVYFNQKTAPQFRINPINPQDPTNEGIDFQSMYWLRGRPEQLNGVGKLLTKNTYPFQYSDYASPNGAGPFWFSGLGNLMKYWPYLIVKISQQTVINSNSLQAYGFVAIGYDYTTMAASTCLPWYELNSHGTSLANDYYLDVIYLPAPLEMAYGNSMNSGLQMAPIKEYNTSWISQNAEDVGSTGNYYPNLSVYYTYGGLGANWIMQDTTNAFLYLEVHMLLAYYLEPALINYFKFRCRSSGEDSFVDLTSFCYSDIAVTFPNATLSSVFKYLLSFQIGLNLPNLMITNIPFHNYINFPNVGYTYKDLVWGYSEFVDSIYTVNIKTYGSSASNAWANYMANHRNSYHMGLNISHMAVQQSQANLAKDISQEASNAANIGSMLFDPSGYVNNLAQGASNIAIGTFQEESQNDRYQYQRTGLKEDMSRVSNLRLANNGNSFNENSLALTWILEAPVQMEQIAICNYFALNGYQLNKWEPWKFWNTRTYFNFMKISYFSDTMIPNLNVFYKQGIDKLLNKGVRVFNVAYFEYIYNGPNGYNGNLNFWDLTKNPAVTIRATGAIYNPQNTKSILAQEWAYLANLI